MGYMTEYRDAPEYAQIGAEVINKVKELQILSEADIRIGFLASAKAKETHKKPVYGECKKVDELYKVFCPYDFLIIIYEENISHMDDAQLRILIEHELLHVGYSEDKNGNPIYSIVPHDYGEFEQIERKYGNHWSRRK